MSYDVSIRLPVKGFEDKWVEVADLGNITWNVRELIRQSRGWEIKNEDNNGGVLAWMKKIKHARRELWVSPEKYKQYESPNGWGTVGGTLQFYETCLDSASNWINDNEELLPAAVVWVS